MGRGQGAGKTRKTKGRKRRRHARETKRRLITEAKRAGLPTKRGKLRIEIDARGEGTTYAFEKHD